MPERDDLLRVAARVGIKFEHLPMTHNGSPVYVVDSASDAGPGNVTPNPYVCLVSVQDVSDALAVERRIG
jgi:hypothetical protein